MDRETGTPKSYGSQALTLKVTLGTEDILLIPNCQVRAGVTLGFLQMQMAKFTISIWAHMGAVKCSLYLPDADTLPFLTMVSPQLMCPALN